MPTQYAKALYAARKESSHKDAELLSNLKKVLAKRGHERLMGKIFTEYEKLELAEKRRSVREKASHKTEHTRVLLELYQKLIA